MEKGLKTTGHHVFLVIYKQINKMMVKTHKERGFTHWGASHLESSLKNLRLC